MAVDTQAFITELQQYGTVDFCDINDEKSYVVVISNYTADEATFLSLADAYLIQDYPKQVTLTIMDGVLKTEYDN